MRKVLTLCAVALFLAGPAAAQPEDIGFKPVPSRDIAFAPFTDAQVDELIATLDVLLGREKDPAKRDASWRMHTWRFQNRLDQGVVSPAQEAKIAAYVNGMAEKFPPQKELLARVRDGLTLRGIGKPAPEIAGRDLDGVEFKLSDYRGKVVALYFSGDWCGPCRGEYPYQRLLMEVYKDQPFAILSVNSDTLEVAKKAKVEKHLTYRSWWDGNQKETTKGPIATAWNVVGWPTIYLIDHKGTIRFVNLRNEDVIKGVKQLMREVPRPETTTR